MTELITKFLFKNRPDLRWHSHKFYYVDTIYDDTVAYFIDTDCSLELRTFLMKEFDFKIEPSFGEIYYLLRQDAARELLANAKLNIL